jgi:hypothetical protein
MRDFVRSRTIHKVYAAEAPLIFKKAPRRASGETGPRITRETRRSGKKAVTLNDLSLNALTPNIHYSNTRIFL